MTVQVEQRAVVDVMSYVHDLPRPKMWRGRALSTYTGGMCRSDDGARNWNCSSDWIPATAPTHILLDPESPAAARVLYVAAFGKGVYKSTDGGDHWVLKNSGIAQERAHCMAPGARRERRALPGGGPPYRGRNLRQPRRRRSVPVGGRRRTRRNNADQFIEFESRVPGR